MFAYHCIFVTTNILINTHIAHTKIYLLHHIYVAFCSLQSIRIICTDVIASTASAKHKPIICHNTIMQGIAPLLGFDVDIIKNCVECVTLNPAAAKCVNASTSALLPSVSLGNNTTCTPPCREDIAKVRLLYHVTIGISLFCHYSYIVQIRKGQEKNTPAPMRELSTWMVKSQPD